MAKTRMVASLLLLMLLMLSGASWVFAQGNATGHTMPSRPKGPCDIYGAAGDPCVAAHSTTRSLYSSYDGPLYQVLRQSDGKMLDIGVVQPSAADAGGYANAAAQDSFCANTYCWISTIYDQSPKHNHLTQAPRGGFSGPAMGGFNNLPIADMAPVTVMGHKVYGVFIAPGMGLRQNDAKGTAVDDQAEGQYWVINGLHHNSGCCFDYGNAEIDSRDDGNGTMETTYYGDSGSWYHGNPPGPWVMTDQENNLVGCVTSDRSKLCKNLPSISWRFVTAMAKGEPHHWTSMGGNAQQGELSVMFDGPRIDSSYDPMRKQGAILLGNGGDNSNSSQGTFYEGAMTASGTFPTDATDQQVQANVVAAKYNVAMLTLAPAAMTAMPPGLQTFSPGSSQEATVTFTNTTSEPVTGVKLSLSLPNKQWSSVVQGAGESSQTFAEAVAPGASVSATFAVRSGTTSFNGDLIANATWNSAHGRRIESAVEKVRNVNPVKINEIRIGTSAPKNQTNSFIELYNAGASTVDISNWALTEHSIQQAIFTTVQIPAGTKLAAHGFYLLGLSNSGLAVPARVGDSVLNVSSTSGMSAGDTVTIDTGANSETRKIVKIGNAASHGTTLWQPVPEGPVITIPAGSTNVPVTNTADFVVGEKVALGYGTVYPVIGSSEEKYEVATVTAVGKAGTQAFLAADAPSGATNIKVTSVANISAGDKIRLDIDSPGHGIETVTVKSVGTQAIRATLATEASAGASSIKLRNVNGFAVGDKIAVGTPANLKTVTITSVGTPGPTGTGLSFTPALPEAHSNGEDVVAPGTGLELEVPLRFNHAANLPFSDRGTGITFQPATVFAHSSNEPVQALGTGITLDSALARGHAIDAVVQDARVTTAGYQGAPAPNQWFGGPALSVIAGAMVLRDSGGFVVDSLNYGGLVDPWASEGYQGLSGAGRGGCYTPLPSSATMSAGRSFDGRDTDSNCNDFQVQAAAALSTTAKAGTTNLRVSGVAGFIPGETILLGSGSDFETAVIANVGTAGATTTTAAVTPGATVLSVENVLGFVAGQTITIGEGSNLETGVVAFAARRGPALLTLSTPLRSAHGTGTSVAGTGITLAKGLAREHASGEAVTDNFATPGASNKYSKNAR